MRSVESVVGGESSSATRVEPIVPAQCACLPRGLPHHSQAGSDSQSVKSQFTATNITSTQDFRQSPFFTQQGVIKFPTASSRPCHLTRWKWITYRGDDIHPVEVLTLRNHKVWKCKWIEGGGFVQLSLPCFWIHYRTCSNKLTVSTHLCSFKLSKCG